MWPARPFPGGLSDSLGKTLAWVIILAPTFLPEAQRNWRLISQRMGEVVALFKIGFYWVMLQSPHFAFLLTKLNV